MSEPKPSVGDMVHYVSFGTPGGEYGQECRAAIVTETLEFEPGSAEESRRGEVGLCVLNPTGQFFNRGVRFGKGDAPCVAGQLTGGSWHWPARAERDPERAGHQPERP